MPTHAHSTTLPLWWRLRRERPPAAVLLRKLGIYDPPVDMDAVAAKLGVDVYEDGLLPFGTAGRVRVDDDPPLAEIYVRAADPFPRQRFTIAHEIGHLMLHSVTEAERAVVFEGGRIEREANQYAAALLMPDSMVRQYATAASYDVDRLARIFQVSKQAMQYRLDNLGIR